MKKLPSQWTHREKAFSAFITGPLLSFWRQRQERQFVGKEGVTIRYVRLTSASHKKAILIVPGRSETYVKYPEVAWDLFNCGYDIFIIDHRGQGLSDRLLDDPQLGHVVQFSDYVDDLAQLCDIELSTSRYQQTFALAHSMGGAIVTLLSQRQPDRFTATALVAPMFGIVLPMPEWVVERILNWTEARPHLRETFAYGTRHWHAIPFGINTLTHSRVRYQRNIRFYADQPELQIGGPTTHWVREAILAGRHIENIAPTLTHPVLLLQASEDQVVDNQAQDRFCLARNLAGFPCYGDHPQVMDGARHEILFEKDEIRAKALQKITDYFLTFNT
ncbi:lysophospholipase L2 [Rosenbergiella australiborealis]|uniref:lysophospholipase L2 n=1 Tax=Rosenbergiella australiborealis TaxID=1544696 RepID=UPI001F4E5048|nr:lysophospholipase L2 [Rosenbergiella australiborealis]